MSIIQKYNIPGPRYTSYPTVPYWEEDKFNALAWEDSFITSFNESNSSEGISLYIHLPYCESLCTFCACNKRITKNHSVEMPYIKAVIAEWKMYVAKFGSKPIIKELHLGGGTPTFFSPTHLEYLLQSIFKDAIIHPEHEFSLEGHPNNTTIEHLQVLYNLGFKRISFGVQDYDETVQKAIHRIQSFETVKKVTEEARKIGFTSISHDLIFGLPFQTKEKMFKTIELTKQLQPDRLAFYSYAHVPWLKGNGQRGFDEKDLPSGEEKRELYESGKILLQQLGYQEIGMDHFALEHDSMFISMKEKKLHRNFMGYSSSKTQLMIGLGVSSISDSWYAFAQNVKTVEEYYKAIHNNQIPVYRGHILTNQDLIIRKHILNLMCNLETNLSEDLVQLIQFPQIMDRLGEMINDNLLKIELDKIIILEKGRPFVRNICMAFDLRMMDKRPETRLFSMTI